MTTGIYKHDKHTKERSRNGSPKVFSDTRKGFCLSDERVKVEYIRELDEIDDSNIVFSDKSVKEFVRRLKDNINSKGSYYANPEIKKELKESIKRDWNDNWQEISLIIEQTCKFKEEEFFREIDKLAGEKLSK